MEILGKAATLYNPVKYSFEIKLPIHEAVCQ